ncbi:hypothetical protein GCM10027446_15010 [Angustibacter peucedani]
MTRTAPRQVSAASVVLGAYWVVVLALTLLRLPGRGSTSGLLLAGPVHVLLWLVGLVWTLALVRPARRRAAWRALAAVVVLALGVTLVPWAALSPRAYHATHRWAFAAAGAHVGGRATQDVAGSALPLPWSLLSSTGRVTTVFDARGHALPVLPVAYGIPDGMAGFTYVGPDRPPDGLYDLEGDPTRVADGVDLGDGWWYVG